MVINDRKKLLAEAANSFNEQEYGEEYAAIIEELEKAANAGQYDAEVHVPFGGWGTPKYTYIRRRLIAEGFRVDSLIDAECRDNYYVMNVFW